MALISFLRSSAPLPLRALRGAASLRSRTLAAACSTAPRDKGATFTESTEDYRFVERLVPPTRIPDPPPRVGAAPSGWTPPAESPPPLPYMVRRSRMHNVPVYSERTHGNRRLTLVRRVEGDIWALDRDVREHLRAATGRELATQVNEVTMTLKVKGHVEQELKDWLASKGF